MRTDRAGIATPQGPLSGYLATPDGWRGGPAVVVVQEWWGLNDHIASIARRLADEGFAALAPDLYRGRQTSEPDEAEKLLMATGKGEAMTALRAAIGWTLDELGASRVGVIGFCMGGSLAWDVAMTDDRVGAVVAFYGGADLGGSRVPMVPVQAHDAALDDFPQAMLDEARVLLGPEFYWYEQVGHGFMNDTRDEYAPDAAAVAWERATTFLHSHVGGLLWDRGWGDRER